MKPYKIITVTFFLAIAGCASVSEIVQRVPSSFWSKAASVISGIFTSSVENPQEAE